MHYYSPCTIWDNIIVAGIGEYSVIITLIVAATAIVTARHGNDYNMTWIGIINKVAMMQTDANEY